MKDVDRVDKSNSLNHRHVGSEMKSMNRSLAQLFIVANPNGIPHNTNRNHLCLPVKIMPPLNIHVLA